MSELLAALSVLFIIGGVFVLAANYATLPTVPFLILAGLVSGVFVDEQMTLELAQWGIAFLVFSFGAHIQFAAVRPILGDGELIALGGVVVVGSLGILSGLLIGLPATQAAFLGLAAALSSTIVGTTLIEQDIQRRLVHGRLAESIQFVHDLLAIGFVLVIGIETFTAVAVLMSVSYGVGLVAAGIATNRLLFDRLATLAAGSDELKLVGVVSLLVVFLAAAEFVGVSIVVGAFAAGLAIRPDPAAHLGMLNGLKSITDFFAAVFFLTLGALVAVPTLTVVLIAGVLGVLTAVVKPAVTIWLSTARGYEARSSTLTGFSLDQVSEFALVITIEALLLGIIFPEVFDGIILAAAATMITSSLSSRHSDRLYETLSQYGLLEHRHEQVDRRSSVPETIADHVVIVGFGRQGQRLVDRCKLIDQPYVVIENDPTLLDGLDAMCENYVFGDAMDSYTWEKAQIEDAQLVVSTVDSERLSERLLAVADEADVILRADLITPALGLLEAGALYVNVPDRLAAERLVELIEALLASDISREELRDRQLTELTERPRQ